MFLAGNLILSGLAAEEEKNKVVQPLSWDQGILQITVPVNETRAEGWFVFTNNSDKPVKLLKVESDCDCIVTQTDLIVYYPGESGVLVAAANIPADKDVVDKSIKVTSQTIGEVTKTNLLRLIVRRLNSKNNPPENQKTDVETKSIESLSSQGKK